MRAARRGRNPAAAAADDGAADPDVVRRHRQHPGNLHAVTDFSAFRGGPPTPANPLSRLLLIGTRHGGNAALLVERLLGLKNPELFEAVPPDETDPAWVAGRMVDADGRPWKKLDVRGLLADPEFMEIGL